MRHRTRNPHKLKVRRYVEHMIDSNEYLDFFTWSKASDKIGETVLNEFIFHSTPNGWISQACAQGFILKGLPLSKILTFLSVWKYLKIFMRLY